MVGPDGYLGKYRKVHVSTTENAFYRRGTAGSIVETDIGRIGLGICADMTYRTPWIGYRDSVDIVAVSSAWPDWRRARHFPLMASYSEVIAEAVRSLPAKLSRALGAPVIHANCAGPHSIQHYPLPFTFGIKHRGASNIAQDGVTVAEAMEDAVATLVVSDIQTRSTPPDDSAWSGPWIPGADMLMRFQIYGTDLILNTASRVQYMLSRPLRRRFLV